MAQVSNEINILIVGDSGVGKSTMINGFVAYCQFDSVEEAEKSRSILEFPIPMQINVKDPTTRQMVTYKTGKPDDTLENYQQAGQSVTQQPMTYEFMYGTNKIVLIDTPGLNDTRGKDQDKQNFDSIFRHLGQFHTLNGICILLKAGESRLNDSIKYGITEIVRNLHGSALSNVVFCITRCKGYDYGPGDTVDTLSAFLKENSLEEKIKCDDDHVFCVDNEAVSYLIEAAASDKNLPVTRRNRVEESWEVSTLSIKRLLDQVVKQEPHRVDETLSISNVNRILEFLPEFLMEAVACIAKTVNDFANIVKELKRCEANQIQPQDITETVYDFEVIQLDHSMTVCTSSSCVKVVNGRIHYAQVCDPHCKYARTLWWCEAMRRGTCTRCGHKYDQHAWHTTETRVTERKVVNPLQLKGLKDKLADYKTKEQNLIAERDNMLQLAAKLGVFILQNTSLSDLQNDSLVRCLKKQIGTYQEKITGKPADDGELYKSIEEWKTVLSLYQDKLQDEHKNAKEILYTVVDADKWIAELKKMPSYGQQVAKAIAVRKEATETAQRASRVQFTFQNAKKAVFNFFSRK